MNVAMKSKCKCMILIMYLWLWLWRLNGDQITTSWQANWNWIATFRHNYGVRCHVLTQLWDLMSCFGTIMRSVNTFWHKHGIRVPCSGKLIVWIWVSWENQLIAINVHCETCDVGFYVYVIVDDNVCVDLYVCLWTYSGVDSIHCTCWV